MRINGGYTRTAKILIGVSLTIAVIFGFVLGGLGVIVDTNEQAEKNFEAINENKKIAAQQATILRIVLAVTGCSEFDSDQECKDKRKRANLEEGRQRLQAVECIERAVKQGKDKFTVYRECGIE